MGKTRKSQNSFSDLEKPFLIKEVGKLNKQNRRLKEKLRQVEEENRALKAQLDEYRKKMFKKNKSKSEDEEHLSVAKKRGAPIGHRGVTRTRPKKADKHVDVILDTCPDCGGKNLSRCKRYEYHYQEDIVLPEKVVTQFRHYYYYCKDCKKSVHGTGEGEMPGSYIGPVAKSLAVLLHYQMSVPYRKIKQLFSELFHLNFVPSSTPGFDRQIRTRGQPIYNELKKSLPEKPFIHADETGWSKDGINHWLWCYIAADAIVYLIDRSRGSKVVESVLGKKYSGVLISDFLASYNRIICRKQRCLVHLLRLIKKQLIYFDGDKKKIKYFLQLKTLVKEILELSRQTELEKLPDGYSIKKADLVGRLRRILKRQLHHPKADKFIKKLNKKIEELITCLEFGEVCAHNNLAERLIRSSVIMRKITFGNRSTKGVLNHQVLMSLLQTARLHQLTPLTFFHQLLTNPAAAAAAILPRTASMG